MQAHNLYYINNIFYRKNIMTRIYLDCDGVLADFDAGFKRLFDMGPREYEDIHGTGQFWHVIRTTKNFYAELPPMQDAFELFNAVEYLRPIILTGCPFGGWAELQKMKWRDRHFPGVPMVTCMSKNKRDYCKPGDFLIDDYLKYRDLWTEAKGTFIHHTSAANSIKQLKDWGILYDN
jgi:hypothetical protein